MTKIVFPSPTLAREALLHEMKKDCEALVKEAIASKEYMDGTGNLTASLGAAVYQDSVFLPQTLYSIGSHPTEPREWYGEAKYGDEELRKYFLNYKPRKKGYTIVLVAAMPYSEVLEKSKSHLKRKYKVITGAYGLMRELAEKYEGKRSYKRRKYGQGIRTIISIVDE